MAGTHLMKRIPLIKFPQRHPKPSSGSGAPPPASSIASDAHQSFFSKQQVPPNPAVGGKASLQPKRTPVSEKEIEAIMLGGCF
ncbi:hypothetical protein FRX31_029251 [Thalictrum thalictroides]|uniref:Uncharacterized protein n=1 Tax=Thalictrum thalictroides TaxID=46969 RepID=A0A7J6V884_THATH|nr:hypothetical protein FRX31_029251 [Thalictrum thalictroides]